MPCALNSDIRRRLNGWENPRRRRNGPPHKRPVVEINIEIRNRSLLELGRGKESPSLYKVREKRGTRRRARSTAEGNFLANREKKKSRAAEQDKCWNESSKGMHQKNNRKKKSQGRGGRGDLPPSRCGTWNEPGGSRSMRPFQNIKNSPEKKERPKNSTAKGRRDPRRGKASLPTKKLYAAEQRNTYLIEHRWRKPQRRKGRAGKFGLGGDADLPATR